MCRYAFIDVHDDRNQSRLTLEFNAVLALRRGEKMRRGTGSCRHEAPGPAGLTSWPPPRRSIVGVAFGAPGSACAAWPPTRCSCAASWNAWWSRRRSVATGAGATARRRGRRAGSCATGYARSSPPRRHPPRDGRSASSCQHTHRSTQPCIPPRSLNRVPASAVVRAGMSPLPSGR